MRNLILLGAILSLFGCGNSSGTSSSGTQNTNNLPKNAQWLSVNYQDIYQNQYPKVNQLIRNLNTGLSQYLSPHEINKIHEIVIWQSGYIQTYRNDPAVYINIHDFYNSPPLELAGYLVHENCHIRDDNVCSTEAEAKCLREQVEFLKMHNASNFWIDHFNSQIGVHTCG